MNRGSNHPLEHQTASHNQSPREQHHVSKLAYVAARPSTLLLVALLWFSQCLAAPATARASNLHVDLALVLGLDISNSVDWHEYRLQRKGLAHALRHPDVVAAIRRGHHRRIAVVVVHWSGRHSQKIAIPWTVISGAADAGALSRRVTDMPRLFGGHATHIAGMIGFGTNLLRGPTIDSGHVIGQSLVAARKVIDISGDGHDNTTKAPGRARDEAIAAGITINGLAIENEEKNLHDYYRSSVIGGPGAFVIRVSRYQDFGEAMKRKLIREIDTKLLTNRLGADWPS